MRDRAFFLLVSAAYLAVTALGVAYLWFTGHAHAWSDVLFSALVAVAFAGVAWVKGPAPADACPRCGGARGGTRGFCGACGVVDGTS